MRQRTEPPEGRTRPLVGIAADGVSGYGRAVMRGVMRYANEQRRWLIHEELRRVFDSVAGWPACDGAIVAGSSRRVFDYIRRRSRHVIHCSGGGDPGLTPVVCLDDAAVGALAAEHLLDCRLGHFAFFGRAGQGTSENRARGFAAALGRRGFACRAAPVDWPSSSDRIGHRHWPRLIPWLRKLPKPVGILAMDDTAASDLAAACLQAGVRVPDEVAIVGVNNDDLLCDSAWPPLSSVEADFSRVGYAAAGLLDRLLKGEAVGAGERLVRLPPVRVVRRMSTELLAVDDPAVADAVRFIREHACDPCTVRDVLARVPVARRWLERQFARKLGRSPHDEILRVRMETARQLLARPDVPTADVAARCGFSEPTNLIRAFRRVTGVTPAAFRRAALRGTA